MYQLKGKKAYHAKLDGILKFAAYLGNPEKKIKSIHVAGTNGKGSSSHMLSSILQEAGYKVGLYTSPHLKDFRERIKIDAHQVDKRFVVDFIQRHQPFFDKHKLSFFEMSVGMAFDFFVGKKVDIAIVEVGLGGRFDSTNIILPEVALITNIGFDHMDMLGDTLNKIAFEKAGVIKENTPIVISEFQEEISETFRSIATSKNAKIVFADQTDQKVYETSLLGHYQSKNVKGVLATLKALKGFKIEEAHITAGLLNVVQNTRLMGRWQVLQRKPIVVCDTAHNSEGLTLVLQQIQQQRFEKLHIVLGFVKDKNLDAVLPLFPNTAQYYFCRPNIERGLDVHLLAEKAETVGLRGEVYRSVSEAYIKALESANKSDFVFVGGSTFTVAEVL